MVCFKPRCQKDLRLALLYSFCSSRVGERCSRRPCCPLSLSGLAVRLGRAPGSGPHPFRPLVVASVPVPQFPHRLCDASDTHFEDQLGHGCPCSVCAVPSSPCPVLLFCAAHLTSPLKTGLQQSSWCGPTCRLCDCRLAAVRRKVDARGGPLTSLPCPFPVPSV